MKSGGLSPADWHTRYLQQARWTRYSRQYLFTRAAVNQAEALLEVGCGTGALLCEINSEITWHAGLDLNLANLSQAQDNAPQAALTQGDAHRLPYAEASFDAVFCHFLLLWVKNPIQVVREMARVTRPGGSILALAEPDHYHRIDYPDELVPLGQAQTRALRTQQANTRIGLQLGDIFIEAGLQVIERGLLGGQWNSSPDPTELGLEWKVIRSDLAGVLPAWELENYQKIDAQAWQNGSRVLYIPTFYAWGKKPA